MSVLYDKTQWRKPTIVAFQIGELVIARFVGQNLNLLNSAPPSGWRRKRMSTLAGEKGPVLRLLWPPAGEPDSEATAADSELT